MTSELPAVHLTAGEGLGWAIDEDLRLLREALDGAARLTSLREARIVHSVWWHRLVRIDPRRLEGKHVLCYADNAPFHYITQASFVRARPLVDTWIGRSRQAVRQFAAIGLNARFAPYTIDTGLFRPLAPDDPSIAAARAKWGIPDGVLLVANFHRDSDGRDFRVPKLQKGPDLFVEVMRRLRADGVPAHALLAGPRRHYIRAALAGAGVPFTFAGREIVDRDDMRENVLSREELNVLYNLGAVYLVTSRWEGGPHSILEAAAACCRVASTRVGLAEDVLDAGCLFDTVEEGAALLAREHRERWMAGTVGLHRAAVMERHATGVLRDHLREIYDDIPRTGPVGRTPRTPFPAFRDAPHLYAVDRIRSMFAPPRVFLSVHPAHEVFGRALRAAVGAAHLPMVSDPRRCDMAVVVSDGDDLPEGAGELGARSRRVVHVLLGRSLLDGPAHDRAVLWNRGAWTTALPSIEEVTRSVGAGRPWNHPLVIPVERPEAAADRIFSLLTTP